MHNNDGHNQLSLCFLLIYMAAICASRCARDFKLNIKCASLSSNLGMVCSARLSVFCPHTPHWTGVSVFIGRNWSSLWLDAARRRLQFLSIATVTSVCMCIREAVPTIPYIKVTHEAATNVIRYSSPLLRRSVIRLDLIQRSATRCEENDVMEFHMVVLPLPW